MFHLIVDCGCFRQTMFLMFLHMHFYTCKHEFIQNIVLVMSIKNCSFQVICTSAFTCVYTILLVKDLLLMCSYFGVTNGKKKNFVVAFLAHLRMQ